jgi:xanthine dehydrogenase YagR molybdenum-binding subunit
MIFGIGAVLTEEVAHDPRTGKIVNHDLASYHVPVHADVPPIEVIFLDERDPWANPLQAKGIGELGISGAGAAIANAVYNATGVRVRDYPLTPDKIFPNLPGR